MSKADLPENKDAFRLDEWRWHHFTAFHRRCTVFGQIVDHIVNGQGRTVELRLNGRSVKEGDDISYLAQAEAQHATVQRQVEQSRIEEHQGRDESRQAAETGGGDCTAGCWEEALWKGAVIGFAVFVSMIVMGAKFDVISKAFTLEGTLVAFPIVAMMVAGVVNILLLKRK